MSARPFSNNGVEVYLAKDLSEMTEGLEWYNNVQGAITTHDNALEGIRIGGSGPGEIIMGRTVCTFIARDTQEDGRAASTSATKEGRVKMGLEAIREQQRVGIIVEGGHQSLVSAGIRLPEPERFAVAGAFIVTDIWYDWFASKKSSKKPSKKPNKNTSAKAIEEGASKEDSAADRVIMIRLEKFEDGDIWWDDTVAASSEEETEKDIQCDSCSKPIIRRYQEGAPFCGHPDCATSLDSSNYTDLLKETRTYAASYLARRTPITNTSARPFNLLPPAPASLTVDQLKACFANSLDHHPGWKSWVCSDCKRFDCRMIWDRVICRNCNKTTLCPIPDMTLESFVDPKWLNITNANDLLRATSRQDKEIVSIKDASHGLEIVPIPDVSDRYVGVRIDLSSSDTIFVLAPTNHEIYRSGGTRDQFNAMWAAVQSGIIPLSRKTTKSDRSDKIGAKTAQFNATYVVSYAISRAAYTCDGAYPLQTAPTALHDLIAGFVLIVEAATGAKTQFNSHLLLGYFPKMHMGFHQDNEKHIKGQIIASVSLGGSAMMAFAPPKGKGARTSKAAFSFPLAGTGGIMIQMGKGINEKWYHESKCLGLARLVCTARKLDEEMVGGEREEEQRPKKKAKLGD